MLTPIINKLRFLRAMGPRFTLWRIGRLFSRRPFRLARHLGAFTGAGIEIGGPSPIFVAKGMFPAYQSASSVDNVTFAHKTVGKAR